MDYTQTVDFLFNSFPVFEKTGGLAYHPGLERIEQLCAHFGNPHLQFKSIHIAGTNGKGSSSHLLASVLQTSGYRTGLFTSPHLKEFTERIKINGTDISKEEVVDFINQHLDYFKNFQASFFEITTLMAFHFFAKAKVDIAIIETGMGGRLDATNIVLPEVSLITNISFDHKQFLGNTLEEIAFEKAGIIKQSIPVVISEKQSETSSVFNKAALSKSAPIYFSDNHVTIENTRFQAGKMSCTVQNAFPILETEVGGHYQEKNIKGVLVVLELLRMKGWKIQRSDVVNGFASVIKTTGIKGRWQLIQNHPKIIIDTAHNEAGLKFVVQQLKTLSYEKLYVVLGMVKDKEIDAVLSLLPRDAYYFFTMPTIPRALHASSLFERASTVGLKGEVVENVTEALEHAKNTATPNDLIFVGGSTFVVAEII